jgi:hypothetical protein
MLLSMRHFNRNLVPSHITTASEILLHWLKGVLREFGLVIEDFIASTTDAGPDVRFMASKLMTSEWEWCVAHMLANSVKESCGWLKNKNMIQQDVRMMIQSMNKMIASIENSKPALAAFRRICQLRLGKEITLHKYLEIRFVGVVLTLSRTLELYDCLVELYNTHFGQPIPIPERLVIDQLCSLFRYVKDIQVHSQSRRSPVACTTLLMLLDLDRKHLHENADLQLENGVVVNHDVLPVVKTTRKVLRRSIDKRFYDRYSMQPNSRGSGKPATSMLLEMATLCHPSYCQLSCLNPIIHRVNKDIP